MVPENAPDGWRAFAESSGNTRTIDIDAPEAAPYTGNEQATVADVVENGLVATRDDPLANALHPPDGSKPDENAAIVAAGMISQGIDVRTVAAVSGAGFDDGTKTADLLLVDGQHLAEVKGVTTRSVARAGTKVREARQQARHVIVDATRSPLSVDDAVEVVTTAVQNRGVGPNLDSLLVVVPGGAIRWQRD